MFIQQPFRVQVSPATPQETPVLLHNALRQYYINKGKEQSTDVTSVLHIDVVNPVLVGDATQVDVIVAVQADTIEFFNQFIHYFVTDEDTDTLRILTVD